MADDADPFADVRLKPEPAAPQSGGASDPFADVRLHPSTEAMAKAYNPQYKGPYEAPQNWYERSPETLKDWGKSAVSGLASGTRGLISTPALITRSADWVARLPGRIAGMSAEDFARADAATKEGIRARFHGAADPSRATEKLAGAAERTFGPTAAYEPKSVAGPYIKSAAELVPGALAGGLRPGPGIVPRLSSTLPADILKYAVAPGVVGQGASDISDRLIDKRVSPYIKLATELAVAGGTALTSHTVGDYVRDGFAGIAPAERDAIMTRAESMMANSRAHGVNPTWAEVIDEASNGRTGFGALQRRIAQSGGKAAAPLRQMYSERPGLVQAAGRSALSDIAESGEGDIINPITGKPESPPPLGPGRTPEPPTPTPNLIGTRAAEAARTEVGTQQAGINIATRPEYAAAEQFRIPDAQMAQFRAVPLYVKALREVRDNPELNHGIETLPDSAVEVQDAVQRHLGTMAQKHRTLGEASLGNKAADNLESVQTQVQASINQATGSRLATPTAPTVTGPYEQGRSMQSQLRAHVMDQINAGPLGKIAQGDATTRGAIDAIFSETNSPEEVTQAMKALSKHSPWAAQQLVRHYAEGIFNEATADLQGGPNIMGGPKFVQAMRANPRVADNFQAALKALPDGEARAEGFQRFLDALQPMRRNLPAQSITAFETKELAKMGRSAGGPLATVPRLMELPLSLRQRAENWMRGKNLGELADLITNPEAGPRFRQLLGEPDSGSPRARALITRLMFLAASGK
jgi:hypothetical protein